MSGSCRLAYGSAALTWVAFISFTMMMFVGTTASAGGLGLEGSHVRYDSVTGDLVVCGHLYNYA